MSVGSVLLSRYGRAAAALAKEKQAGSRDEEALKRIADLAKARGGFFCSFSQEVLAEICQRFKYQATPRDVTLFQEGQPSEDIYLVATGRLRLRQRQGRQEGDDDNEAELIPQSNRGGPMRRSSLRKTPGSKALQFSRSCTAPMDSEHAEESAPKEPSSPRRRSSHHASAHPFFSKIMAMRMLASRGRSKLNLEEEEQHTMQPSASAPTIVTGPETPTTAKMPRAGGDVPLGPLRDASRLAVPLTQVVKRMAQAQGLVSSEPGANTLPSYLLHGAGSEPDSSFGGMFTSLCKSIGVHDPDDHFTTGAPSKGGPPPGFAVTCRSQRPRPNALEGEEALEREHDAAEADSESESSSSQAGSSNAAQHAPLAERKSQTLVQLQEAADADHANHATTREAGPGHLVGIKACLSEQPYYFTVTTAEPCELLVISAEAFRECTELERKLQRVRREQALLTAAHGLKALEKDKFERLAECFRSSQHRRGTVLCWEGESRTPYAENDRLQILMEGQARTVKNWDNLPDRPSRGQGGVAGQRPPLERDAGSLLPGQVVNGASQLLGTREPFTVIVESAEAVVISAARSELSRLAGSGVLEDLRAAAEAAGRWHAQRLEALEGGLRGQLPAPPKRPAGFKAPAGAPLESVPKELMHEAKSAMGPKKPFAARRSPPAGPGALGEAEGPLRRPASPAAPGPRGGGGAEVGTAAALPGGPAERRRPRRWLVAAGGRGAASAGPEGEEAASPAPPSSAITVATDDGSGQGPRSARGRRRPSVSDAILWPCTPSASFANSALLELARGLEEHQSTPEASISGAVSGHWDGVPHSLLAAALGQLTSQRARLNETLTPWHLERLETRGDKAILVPLGPIDPMQIAALDATQERPEPPAPPAAEPWSETAPLVPPPPSAAGQRRTRLRPQPVQRRPWQPELAEDELNAGGSVGSMGQLLEVGERTLPVGQLPSGGGSGGRNAASSPSRVLLEELPPLMRWQLDGLGEALGRLGDLDLTMRESSSARPAAEGLEASRTGRLDELFPEVSVGRASTGADEGSIWDHLFSVMSSGAGSSLISSMECEAGSSRSATARGPGTAPATAARLPRGVAWQPRPPQPRSAAGSSRGAVRAQRLKCLTPVETPAGRAPVRRAAPLRVSGIGHWLDTGPHTARR